MKPKRTIIGLTGSIGMGKTTTANMFRDLGLPVWDADLEVHKLYGKGGAAVPEIAAARPEAIVNGTVDRQALKSWMATDPSALPQIEAIVHPLVEQSRNHFIRNQTADIIVLDIPLLFENGLDKLVDIKVVVSTSAKKQRARVLGRKTMTEDQFNFILAKQMPDKDKRALADFTIETSSIERASQQVLDIVTTLRKQNNA